MANNELWHKLSGLDPHTVVKNAGCQYLADEQAYLINMLNSDYSVNIINQEVKRDNDTKGKEVEFLEELCLLAYLTTAQDIPLANKLVRPQDLAIGTFFFRGQHAAPTEKLKEIFGKYPKRLLKACEQLGAKKASYGDVSIEIPVLPRIPVTVAIWAGDEEFEPRASILLDATAANHLLLDALGALLNLTVERLLHAVKNIR